MLLDPSTVDEADLKRWARPVPRYTSYPTVPHWNHPVSEQDWRDALEGIERPLSVYTHVPFCQEQCTFCGCNMVVSRRKFAGERYLDAIERQLSTLPKRQAVRIHLGGGTPTWLTPDQLDRLLGLLTSHFPRIEGAETSIEVDPAVTSDEHLSVLAAHGTTRLSIGVQSFDRGVLAAINRPQEPDDIHRVAAFAREQGWHGLNLDLMVGLPEQTPETLLATLQHALDTGAQRLALYGYAHVPWVKPHQEAIDADKLPDTRARLALTLAARDFLLANDFIPIGIDHYARRDDELAQAWFDGRLHRNFMGYTTWPDLPLLGLGPSAISELDGLFAQHEPHLGKWYRAVESKHPLVHKGYRMTPEDYQRGVLIRSILCQPKVDLAALEAELKTSLAPMLATAEPALVAAEQEGWLTRDNNQLTLTDEGQLFARHVARAFDGFVGGAKYSAGL